MQLGNMPEAEPGRQFMAQERGGVLQGGHGLPLFALGAADRHLDIGVPAVGADMDIHHLDGQQPRIFGFEADNLRKLFPDRLRDP